MKQLLHKILEHDDLYLIVIAIATTIMVSITVICLTISDIAKYKYNYSDNKQVVEKVEKK